MIDRVQSLETESLGSIVTKGGQGDRSLGERNAADDPCPGKAPFDALASAGIGTQATRPRRELAVIDPAVPGLASLLLGLRDGVDAIVLDPRREPLGQLAAAVAERPGLGTLHVIAHGAAGEIRLGNRAVSAATLASEPAALRILGDALAADGRIALWSCSAGAGPDGAALCRTLARATGAAVDASSRPIGAGAAWQLDVSTGAPGQPWCGSTAAAPILAAVAAEYAGVLSSTLAVTSIVDNVGTIQGNIGQGGVTNDSTVTFNGTMPAGADGGVLLLHYLGPVFNDTYVVYTVVPAGQTTWTFTTPPLPDGAQRFYVELNWTPVGTTTPHYVFTIDTAAPTATAAITNIVDNLGSVQGNIAAGGMTDDTTPTLSGTLSGTLAAGEGVAVYDGATRLGLATVIGTTWSYTTAALGDGAHSFTVRLEDAAGNIGATASAAYGLTIDTVAPAATATITGVVDDAGTIQGNIGPGGATNDTTPTLSGTVAGALAAGDGIAVYVGATRLGLATLSGTTWSYTTPALGNGAHSLTVRVEDAVGNGGTPSATRALTIDTVAPTTTAAITSVVDDVGDPQGSIALNGMTDDTRPTLSGTLSGELAAGEAVAVYDGATRLGLATVSGTTWSYTTSALGEGAHSLTARVEDAVGNGGSASAAHVLTIDTVAPTASAAISNIVDNVGTIQGSVADGGATNDTTLTLSGTVAGTIATGDRVAVYDGATRLGLATISGTSWSYTTAALGDGAHSFTVRVEDLAGNAGATTSAARVLTIDTVAPTATAAITGIVDDVGTIQGDIGPGGTTNDTMPTLSGTVAGALAAGDGVAVYDGATRLGLATISGTTWSYTTAALDDGAHSLTARVEDAVGNAGTASAARALTIDTVGPAAMAGITHFMDDVGTIQGNISVGGATNDTTPTLAGFVVGTVAVGDGVAVYDGAIRLGLATLSGTIWSYTTPVLGDGTHSFTFRVEDAAGNGGATSSARVLTIDTVAPGATAAITSVLDNLGTIAAGGATDDTTPTLSGTLSGGLAAGDAVAVYDGATRLGVAAVNGTTWSYTTPALGDGPHSLTVRVEDAVGNAGTASAAHALTVDTVAPTATATITSIVDDVGTIQGNIGPSGMTNDTTPTLSGTLSGTLAAGDGVAVYDGATRLGFAMVGGTTWSYTTPALDDGAHSLTARVEDAVGNAGTTSAAHVLTIDTVAPTASATITSITDDVGTIQGGIAAGALTDDATPTLSGTVAGTMASGDGVAVYDGATRLGLATVVGTTWSYTPPALGNGMHSLTARVEDAAGNGGTISAAQSLTVINGAEPPLLAGLAAAVTFDENVVNVAPQRLDTDVTFTWDSPAGGMLTVGGLLAEDRVAIQNQGSGAGQIGFDGSSVTYGSTVIGTASGGVGADFIVTLNSAASSEAVEALVEALTFANVSDNPTTTRSLTIELIDANIATTALTVTVTAQNDAPAVSSGDMASFVENGTGTAYQATGTDPDTGTILTWQLGGVDAGLFSIDSNGAVTFRTAPDFEAPGDGDADNIYDIDVIVSDGALTSSKAVSIMVLDGNDAPVVAAAIVDQASPEDAPWSFEVPVGTFTDADGAAPTLSATRGDGTALPSWLSFDAVTRTFSGTPPADFNGQIKLKVVASDGRGGTASDVFVLTIIPVNDPPLLVHPIADQDTTIGQDFSFVVLPGTFADTDAGDSVTLTAALASGAALPDWLVFDAGTASFSGTAPPGSEGSLTIRVTATDIAGAAAADDFVLQVAALVPPDKLIIGTSGDDSLVGGTGEDTLTGAAGADTLDGGEGDDKLFGWQDNDSLNGGTGNDSLYGNAGDDVLAGGADNDLLNGGAGNDTLDGGEGDDKLFGWEDNDGLYGGTGNDSLYGGTGDDVLAGGADNDLLNGGAGADTLDGGEGDDELFGWQDNDSLYGGAGNDSLHGNAGADTLDGGEGDDELFGGQDNDSLNGGTGNDSLYGNAGDDVLAGGADNDLLNGGAGNDTLDGGEGDDKLYGWLDNDNLNGGAGNDSLYGNAGDDVLAGGAGNDLLNGGAGADIFVFGANGGADTVVGFTAEDRIRLEDGLTLASSEIVNIDGDGRLETLLLFGDGSSALLLDFRTTTPEDYLIA